MCTKFFEKPFTLKADLLSGLCLICLPEVSRDEETGFGGMEITYKTVQEYISTCRICVGHTFVDQVLPK